MPSGVPEGSSDAATAIIGLVSVLGGGALGLFVRGFFASFRGPERSEERRVVLETADIADIGGLRGVGAKLAEIHPAVLSTSHDVAAALVILQGQERRAEIEREARRLRDEEKRNERRPTSN